MPGSFEDSEATSVATDVSRAIVSVHFDVYGVRPTVSETLLGDRLLVCLLEDAFTSAEADLVQAGRFDLVRENRQVVHNQKGGLLTGAVEISTRRPVETFLCQVSEDGSALEAFTLGPEP
jgi:hypothetical protein